MHIFKAQIIVKILSSDPAISLIITQFHVYSLQHYSTPTEMVSPPNVASYHKVQFFVS